MVRSPVAALTRIGPGKRPESRCHPGRPRSGWGLGAWYSSAAFPGAAAGSWREKTGRAYTIAGSVVMCCATASAPDPFCWYLFFLLFFFLREPQEHPTEAVQLCKPLKSTCLPRDKETWKPLPTCSAEPSQKHRVFLYFLYVNFKAANLMALIFFWHWTFCKENHIHYTFVARCELLTLN